MCQIIIHGQLTKDGFPALELGRAVIIKTGHVMQCHKGTSMYSKNNNLDK